MITQYFSEYFVCYTIDAILKLQEIAQGIPGITIYEVRSGTTECWYKFVSEDKNLFHQLYAEWDKYCQCGEA